MAWVPTDYFFEQALLEISECGGSSPFSGVLCGAHLGLAVAPLPALTRRTTLADFVEASFPGYSREPLTWRLPYFSAGGLWTLEAECSHWQPTGNLPGQGIVGIFIATAATLGQLLMATGVGQVPIDMSSTQDALTLSVRFQMDPLANWGDFCLLD